MNPAIEVLDLRFAYADGTPALRGVSFRIAPGECVGLIGPNGAGKSTLLWHLNGLLPERFEKASGEVKVDGMVVGGRNLHEIRRKVGLVFQDPNDQIFCPTVYEDVAFGPAQLGLDEVQVKAKVEQAMAQVGLKGFGQRGPHHLSVGEKKRVCMAGVLACEPSILVMDEPSANLDPRGRRELKTLLKTIPITKLIATHDLELVVEMCSRVIVLDGGQVVADGPTIPILGDEAFMLEHGLEKPHILMHRHPHGEE